MQWAAREGETHIAVWGGDGTFSRAVQALYLEKVLDRTEIALVPSGTGNDFARRLKIPDEKRGIGSIPEVRIERYDVGVLRLESGDRIFVNNAGFGRSAEAVRRPRPSALRDIFSFRARTLNLEWRTPTSTEYQTRTAVMGLVFNSPYFNAGLSFDPAIAPDDGLLSGFFEPPAAAIAFISRFVRGRFGKPLVRPSTIRIDGSEIHVEADADLFPQVDGERASQKGVRSLTFSILPRALSLARWDLIS